MAALSSNRALAALALLGVLIRAVVAGMAGTPELKADEAAYVYQALLLNHFDFFSDSYRYLWPPGYSFLLARALNTWELSGLAAMRGLQVAASYCIGLTTMLLARRAFGERSAIAAGWIWVAYLPLVGFTHVLRTETLFTALFLPGLYFLYAVLQEVGDPRGATEGQDRRIAASAVLLALSLYFKEMPLFLLPLLAALLVHLRGPHNVGEGLRRASLFALTVSVLVTPWTLRNAEVYGRLVPVASTLGENVHVGLNAFYRNFDLVPLTRRYFAERTPDSVSRAWFVDVNGAVAWPRAQEIHNLPDRLRENTRRGLAHAAARPSWLLRSRLKKAADFVAPYSFLVRRFALGGYLGGPLDQPWVRRPMILVAIVGPICVLPLAWLGFAATLRDRAGRWLFGTVIGYVAFTSLLVSMSRFRIPIVPLLIPLAAGFCASGLRIPRKSRLAAAGGVALLLFLWWVNAPETRWILDAAWTPRPPS